MLVIVKDLEIKTSSLESTVVQLDKATNELLQALKLDYTLKTIQTEAALTTHS